MKVKKISIDGLLFICLTFFMWILFAFNTYNVDMPSYRSLYAYCKNNVTYPGIEFGFSRLLYLFNTINFNYEQFLIVYSIVIMLLLYWFINRYAEKKFIIMLMYFMYPFLTDVPTVRNFLAEALVLWGLHFIIKDKLQIKDIVKYVITVLIAASFHVVSFAYLIFVLLVFDYSTIKKIFRISLLCEVIGYFMLPTFVRFFSRYIPKLLVYTKMGLNGTKSYTKVFLVVYLLAMLWFENYSDKIGNSVQIREISVFHESGLKILRLTDIFILFSAIDMDFYRLQRNMLLVFYILIVNAATFNNKKRIRGKTNIIMPLSILFVIGLNYVLLYQNSYESIILNIFENNKLWLYSN